MPTLTATSLVFRPPEADPALDRFRAEVRAFLAAERAAGSFVPAIDCWLRCDPAFSRKLGKRGWIGLCWPREHGGAMRPVRYRHVLTEELLAAGAPVGAHWIADRQSGPQILRFGTPEQKREFLPGIAAGTLFFAIGMSEPDAGSDLAAVRTRAVRADSGWRLDGAKIWTSHAHCSHYLIALVRTAPAGTTTGPRSDGLSQFIISLEDAGVSVRPIIDLTGEHHFNEVVFENVFLPQSRLLGGVGEGWVQVTSELVAERSGPERFLSTFPLLEATIEAARGTRSTAAAEAVGRLAARLIALRRMSAGIAGEIERGDAPGLQAALVKDLGNSYEQSMADWIRPLFAHAPALAADANVQMLINDAIRRAPGFSLRGGTREIMRGIIARGLGLR
jgi:alkylation response protein AidB-like acyl-CoA dehydrogenase